MPTHRLVFFLTIAIGLPTLLTFLSLLHTHPRSDYADEPQPRSSLRSFFSFHAPSSLFPPSAIISLTDDNSTFFLARPADFGPALKSSGLSGRLWTGSGFGEDDLGHSGASAGAEGELGCSDVPGWEEKYTSVNADEKDSAKEDIANTTPGNSAADAKPPILPRSEVGKDVPTEDDGTDDYLHHPLPNAPVSKPVAPGDTTNRDTDDKGHADIQSLQESAEINGKVALLSRGGCGFLEKVKWAQRRGATALIVGDDTRGGALVTMYARGDTSNISIPSVFTSHTTAHLLSSLMPPEEEDEGDDGSQSTTNSIKAGSKSHQGGHGMKVASGKSPSVRNRKHALSKGQYSGKQVDSGWASSIKSAFGIGRHDEANALHSDTRRPPSSGRLGLSADKQKNMNAKEDKAPTGTATTAKSKETKGGARKSATHQNDDFVIGVQDWRDPDLVVVQSTASRTSITSTTGGPLHTEVLLNKGKESSAEQKENSALTGGSITPGSGEYLKPGEGDKAQQNLGKKDKKVSKEHGSSKTQAEAPNQKDETNGQEEHAGLWVTITPTTMSTSPFFDTLLVLVVSPLVTLTVVYALLLLRSRIRRRRWRAPKSVVERLPVRTYQTMSTSSTTSSTRYASPQASSPTTPLLQSSNRSLNNRSRPRSATVDTVGDAVSVTLEKASAQSQLTPEKSKSAKKDKKYKAKHVECVVCLEEYVDGQSRIMSLPCGHEFHAECM